MSVTDDIKSRLDIVQYIQQFVPLKKAGRYYKACCPFHNEKTPSFVVNPETQSWRCFGSCAEGGDLFSFAQKYHGWSFGEALEALGQQAGVEVRQQSAEQQQQQARLDALRGLMQAAADYYHQRLADHPEVLRYARERRGFSDETLLAYQIGYAPQDWQTTGDYLRQLGYSDADLLEVGLARRSEAGRVYDYFRHRLMIPIRDERGRVVGFGARALAADDNPKYLNSPQTPLFDKSHLLFGLDRAKKAIRDSETAVIVEGYMDVIQAHQAGFLNVVAQMGTALTETQLKTLAPRWARKIILALDADAAGQNATMRSLEVARGALQADYTGKLAVDMLVLQIPGAKDPDDLIRETPEAWPELIGAAVPVADYVIAVETAGLTAGASAVEREAIARRLAPILLASENDLYRQDNLQKLALRLRIPENTLLALAAEQQRIAQARSPRHRPDEAPPEMPPLNLDALTIPPDEDDAPAAQRPPAPIRQSRQEAVRWEAECLGALLREPDLVYQINRKFRELAGAQTALLAGPLAEFGAADFHHSDYRAVVAIILESLEQDELLPARYVSHRLDAILQQVLLDDQILASQDEFLSFHVRNRFAADRQHILKTTSALKNAALLTHDHVIRTALSLRLQRLRRESEELRLLGQSGAGEDQELLPVDLHRLYAAVVRAISLIDSELRRQIKQVY
jgi:DNA primase